MTNEDLLYSTGNSAQCSVMAYMGQNVKKRKSHVIYKISGVRIASELSKQNKKHLHWKLESKRTMLLKFCGKWIFFPEIRNILKVTKLHIAFIHTTNTQHLLTQGGLP